MKELKIKAKINNLDIVQEFISKEMESAECPMKLQTQVAIVVEEVFVNIAHYAYSPEVGDTTIRINIGDEVVIEFEDEGRPYNPLERDDPDVAAKAEEREIGGLGIFMVKNIMDTVEYRHEGTKNILTITSKSISTSA